MELIGLAQCLSQHGGRLAFQGVHVGIGAMRGLHVVVITHTWRKNPTGLKMQTAKLYAIFELAEGARGSSPKPLNQMAGWEEGA
jgi:hypothetical protein